MSVCVGQQLSSQLRRTSLIMIFDRTVTFWRVFFNYCTFLWQWQPDMAATTQWAKGHQADVGPSTTIGPGQWWPDGFCALGSIYTDERKQSDIIGIACFGSSAYIMYISLLVCDFGHYGWEWQGPKSQNSIHFCPFMSLHQLSFWTVQNFCNSTAAKLLLPQMGHKLSVWKIHFFN